jgi:hypothetical protein
MVTYVYSFWSSRKLYRSNWTDKKIRYPLIEGIGAPNATIPMMSL